MLTFLYPIILIGILFLILFLVIEYIGSLDKFVGTWKYEFTMSLLTITSITLLILIFYYGL